MAVQSEKSLAVVLPTICVIISNTEMRYVRKLSETLLFSFSFSFFFETCGDQIWESKELIPRAEALEI